MARARTKTGRFGLLAALAAAVFLAAPAPGGALAKDVAKTEAGKADAAKTGGTEKAKEDALALKGMWGIAYRDEHLGTVEGRALFNKDGTSVKVELTHPGTRRKYQLESVSVRSTGKKVRIELRGESPSGGETAKREFKGERLIVPSNLTVISARLDETEKTQAVEPGGTADLDRVVLDLEPNEAGRALVGTWSYRADDVTQRDREGRGRVGTFKKGEGGAPSLQYGAESWVPAVPEITRIVVIDDQLHSEHGVISYGYPFKGGKKIDMNTRLLLVIGRNLPQKTGDRNELASDTETVGYWLGSYPDWAKGNVYWTDVYKWGWERLEKETSATEVAKSKKMDYLIIKATLKPGVMPGVRKLTINGAEGNWPLLFGDAAATISIVRHVFKKEYDETDTVLRPETIRIKVRTSNELPIDEIPVHFGTDYWQVADKGKAKKGAPGQTKKDGTQKVMATRLAKKGGKDYHIDSQTYLSPPIQVIGAGPRGPFLPPEAGAVQLKVEDAKPPAGTNRENPRQELGKVFAKIDETFKAEQFMVALRPQLHPEWPRGLVAADLRVTPINTYRSRLWKDALTTTARCHDKPVYDWEELSDEDAKKIWNLIVFTRGEHIRTTNVRFGEQAAMIMLRDTFVEMMFKQIRKVEQILKSDKAVRGFLKASIPNSLDKRFPINRIEVKAPDGRRMSFGVVATEPDFFVKEYKNLNLTMAQVVGWQQAQTMNALEKLKEAMVYALATARDTNVCDVKGLLKVTGFDFRPVVNILKPRLMKLKDTTVAGAGGGSPQRYAQWVPDMWARQYVDWVGRVAWQVKWQEQAASTDNDLLLLAMAVASMGMSAFADGAVVAMIALGADIADFAVTVIKEMSDYLEGQEEIKFAEGASPLLGVDRHDRAIKDAKHWATAALGIVGSGVGAGFSAVEAAGKVSKALRIRKGAKLMSRVEREGFEGLSDAEKANFVTYITDVKVRQLEKGVDSLNEADRAALNTVEAMGGKGASAAAELPPPGAVKAPDQPASGGAGPAGTKTADAGSGGVKTADAGTGGTKTADAGTGGSKTADTGGGTSAGGKGRDTSTAGAGGAKGGETPSGGKGRDTGTAGGGKGGETPTGGKGRDTSTTGGGKGGETPSGGKGRDTSTTGGGKGRDTGTSGGGKGRDTSTAGGGRGRDTGASGGGGRRGTQPANGGGRRGTRPADGGGTGAPTGGTRTADAGTGAATGGTRAADAGTGAATGGGRAADAGTGAATGGGRTADAGTGAAAGGRRTADAGTGAPTGGTRPGNSGTGAGAGGGDIRTMNAGGGRSPRTADAGTGGTRAGDAGGAGTTGTRAADSGGGAAATGAKSTPDEVANLPPRSTTPSPDVPDTTPPRARTPDGEPVTPPRRTDSPTPDARGPPPMSRAEAKSASNIVDEHAEAISDVARARDEVILTRPVNPDATPLIANDAATKGMHVKGKSADWGPQKGYIPVEQKFSKLGNPSKAADLDEIKSFSDQVQKCFKESPPCAGKVPLEVDGDPVMIVRDKNLDTEIPVLQRRDGRFVDPETRQPLDPATLDTSKARPMEVLADTSGTGKPLTADYDLLAIGGREPATGLAPDPNMGQITPAQMETLDAINDGVARRSGYKGGKVVHHGPENQYGKSTGVDYPITAFQPDGGVVNIPKAPGPDPDAYLKDYFHKMRQQGYHVDPNSNWGWGDYDPATGWAPKPAATADAGAAAGAAPKAADATGATRTTEAALPSTRTGDIPRPRDSGSGPPSTRGGDAPPPDRGGGTTQPRSPDRGGGTTQPRPRPDTEVVGRPGETEIAGLPPRRETEVVGRPGETEVSAPPRRETEVVGRPGETEVSGRPPRRETEVVGRPGETEVSGLPPRTPDTPRLGDPDLPPSGTPKLGDPDLPPSGTPKLGDPDLPPSGTPKLGDPDLPPSGTPRLSEPDVPPEVEVLSPPRPRPSSGSDFNPIASPARPRTPDSPPRPGSVGESSGIVLEPHDLRAPSLPYQSRASRARDWPEIWKSASKPDPTAPNLAPKMSDEWGPGAGRDSWTFKGEPVKEGPQLNVDKSKGAFADVSDVVDESGKPVGYVRKKYGLRTDRKGQRTLPSMGEAKEMVEDTLHGAAKLKEADVPQLELVHADVDGVPPGVIQRKLGEHMPEGVLEEKFANDMLDPKTGRLPPEQQRAVLEMFKKLYKNDIFWEDAHLGNVFLQKVKNPDGTTSWRAGISDTDRIDSFSRPRAGGQPDMWIRSFQAEPGRNKVLSRPRNRPFKSAEEALLATLEHKEHLVFDPTNGTLMPQPVNGKWGRGFDRKLLQEYFPSYKLRPDQRGDAGDVIRGGPPKDRFAWRGDPVSLPLAA